MRKNQHKWSAWGGHLFQRYYPIKGKHRKANEDCKQRSPSTYIWLEHLDKERRSWQNAGKDVKHIRAARIAIQESDRLSACLE